MMMNQNLIRLGEYLNKSKINPQSDETIVQNAISEKESLGIANTTFSPPMSKRKYILENMRKANVFYKVGKIPILTIKKDSSGKIYRSVVWRSPSSLGLKNVNNQNATSVSSINNAIDFTDGSMIKQTMFYVGNIEDDFLPVEDTDYGKGVFLYSSLDEAKKVDESIIPVNINVKNIYIISDDNPWRENLKDSLSGQFDAVVKFSDSPSVFESLVFDPQAVKVISEKQNAE